MRILLIGPLPPPMTGNSLPVKVLLDALQADHSIEVVNLTREDHNHKSGVVTLHRLLRILSALVQVWKKQKQSDIIYLTVAESFAGNIRDLFIYFLCRSRLNSVVIHMLGGTAMEHILNAESALHFRLNKFFLSRIGSVVVEGSNQYASFARVIDTSRIHIIPNFAEDYLFVTEGEIADTFSRMDKIRVLFLSNMLDGKGHMELIDAYRSLDKHTRDRISIDFAGKLLPDENAERFLSKLVGASNVQYHGTVSGPPKRQLYADSHIFCLPTYYRYEGQPFCILEAYATGCVVVTTTHSGICDVFSEPENGLEVQKRSVDSLVSVLNKLVDQEDALHDIALNNLRMARKQYTQSAYVQSMKDVLRTVGGPVGVPVQN